MNESINLFSTARITGDAVARTAGVSRKCTIFSRFSLRVRISELVSERTHARACCLGKWFPGVSGERKVRKKEEERIEG